MKIPKSAFAKGRTLRKDAPVAPKMAPEVMGKGKQAPATPPTPAAAPSAIAVRRPAYNAVDKLELLHKEGNPKKRTAAVRFEFYKAAKTVGDYVAAVRKAGGNEQLAHRDIAWDSKMGWVKVVGASAPATK